MTLRATFADKHALRQSESDHVTDAPVAYIAGRLWANVGIEIDIARIAGNSAEGAIALN